MFYPFRLYSVHINPRAMRPYETAVFISEGFNFKAFIFAELWALYHRLWILAFILICLFFLIYTLGAHYGFNPVSVFVLQLGIRIMIGLEANDTLRLAYDRRGYIITDMVAGHTQLEAEQRFYDRYLPQVQTARDEMTAMPSHA